jgi:hypothetical protein
MAQAWRESRHQYELFISESVWQECAAGDLVAAQMRFSVLAADIPLLMIDENALNIASERGQEGIVPFKAAEVALHIAIAQVLGIVDI